MALTQRQQQGATTRSAENSPVMAEFFKGDPEDFGPGVVGGDAGQIREKYAAASRKVWPQTNAGGAHVTTSDSLKAGPRMTCAKCGSETGLLVGPHRYTALCVQCSGSPELGATLAPGPGDDPLPRGKPPLYPTHALDEP